ncbi:class I SAM-dependent methyltransferase [Marinobacterium litorale]|uniref:class I SAM-dependent methyltransferase n=1 Tax=Marinobacterium litorale TaxID=404770 RepID=UPI00041B8D5A|nr:class I SAM-dependent methyltransferase [Marinobacterium litorale]
MSIDKHYDQSLDPAALLQDVQSAYPDGASLFQLAPVDQLHIGGIKASQRLLRHLTPKQRVLDIGSGAGGLMRQAAGLGISMIGLDITHALNRLNRGLNQCLDEPVSTSILTADAHDLPFAAHSIDSILFQHSFLNMPRHDRVLSECRRILRPGGKLIMHEVVRGENPDNMRYPVPWAQEKTQSHLLTAEALRQQLLEAGFSDLAIEDWSADALTWRQRQLKKEESGQPERVALSPARVLGSRFAEMARNLVLNLESDAVRVIEVVAK